MAVSRDCTGRQARSAQPPNRQGSTTNTIHGHPARFFCTLLFQITKCPSTPVVANDFTAPGAPATIEMSLEERGETILMTEDNHGQLRALRHASTKLIDSPFPSRPLPSPLIPSPLLPSILTVPLPSPPFSSPPLPFPHVMAFWWTVLSSVPLVFASAR